MSAEATLPLLAFNFSLGVGTFFSPCGLPMLPAYLAFYLGRDAGSASHSSGGRAALRGLAGGLVAALGALLVLGLAGAGAVQLGSLVKANLILLELVGGLLVLGLGVLFLLDRGPAWTLPVRAPPNRGWTGLFLFGALFAAAAAGCSTPLFLSAVLNSVILPPGDAALALGAYLAGFTGLLVVATALVGGLGGTALRPLQRFTPHVKRAGGAVMIGVGLYLIWYWYRIEFLL